MQNAKRKSQIVFWAILGLLFAQPATAIEPDPRLAAIMPFVDDETMVVWHIDLGRLAQAMPQWQQRLERLPGSQDLQAALPKIGAVAAGFSLAGGREVYYVLGTADVQITRSRPLPGFFVVPLSAGANEQAMTAMVPSTIAGFAIETARFGKSLIIGGHQTIERLKTMKSASRPELSKAFAAAGDCDAQFLFIPTADNRRVVEEIMPTLPKELGGGPSTAVTQGCLWDAVAVQFGDKPSMRLVVQSRDEKAAAQLHDVVAQAFQTLGQLPLVQKTLPDWKEIAKLILPTVSKDQLVLSISDENNSLDRLLTTLVLPAAKIATRDSLLAVTNSRLGQLALALLSSEQIHGRFPPRAILSKDGKPLLSWRVAILPGLDQKKLYDQFHLDEPWDSEHNKKLLDQMPEAYKSPGRPDSNKTAFLLPVGKGTPFESLESLRLKDIAKNDGLTNTILVVEAREDKAVPWTKPEDLEVDMDHPWVGLEDARDGGFLAIFCDRSTHLIKNTISPKALKAAFTANGEESEVEEIFSGR